MAKLVTAPNQDFACVFHQGKVYISYLPKGAGVAFTPAFKLVQNIFEEFKDLSFFILRNRIFTSVADNELDRGMVKVTAKRIRFSVSAEEGEFMELWSQVAEILILGTDQIDFQSQYAPKVVVPSEEKILSPTEGFEFLNEWIQSSQPKDFDSLALHDRNRCVAAMLLGPQNRVMAYTLNSSAINKTLHAEVNLVRQLVRTQGCLPRGSTLLVTHKPCKMCSGVIYSAAEDIRQLKVYYQIEETGAHSTATVLDRYQINQSIK